MVYTVCATLLRPHKLSSSAIPVERLGWLFITWIHGALTPPQVDEVAEKMRAADFTVSSVHGKTLQKERDAIMAEFRSGTS